MLTLQTVLDRIRKQGWQFSEVERAIRAFGLRPINAWTESEWFVLTIIM